MFIKYPSIDNMTDATLKRMRNNELPGKSAGDYILLEKIHGCCVGFGCTSETGNERTFIQRRNAILAPKEYFYKVQHSQVALEMREKIIRLCDFIKPAKQIVVFGELFGGDIDIAPRVIYSKPLRFVAFDICVDETFISYDAMKEHCVAFDIPFVVPLATAPMLQTLEIPNLETLKSVYTSSDVPIVFAEGIILRERLATWDLGDIGNPRFMYKMKREAFSEKKTKQQGAEDTLLEMALDYVTLARMGAVASKELPDIKQHELAFALNNDAMASFMAEAADLWKETKPAVQKSIEKKVKSACFELVKKVK